MQGIDEAAHTVTPPETDAQPAAADAGNSALTTLAADAPYTDVSAVDTPVEQGGAIPAIAEIPSSAAIQPEPAQASTSVASTSVDAGEGPAAKRAKHTGMAESGDANAPVSLPAPAPSSAPGPAAAEPSQGGSLWPPSNLPNTLSWLSRIQSARSPAKVIVTCCQWHVHQSLLFLARARFE